MKRYIESHLRRVEQYRQDLLLAIEECKDCNPKPYLWSLWEAFDSAMDVINQIQRRWPSEFKDGVWQRYVHLRSCWDLTYNCLMKAIDLIRFYEKQSIISSDDLPF